MIKYYYNVIVLVILFELFEDEISRKMLRSRQRSRRVDFHDKLLFTAGMSNSKYQMCRKIWKEVYASCKSNEHTYFPRRIAFAVTLNE